MLRRYSMCKSWDLFMSVSERGYAFGLPSLCEQTATTAGKPPHRVQL